MSIAITEIAGCFEGMIPPVVVTCSADGVPNVVQLSQVHLIDEHHVALSNQFFTKTTANLAENPIASVVVIEPETFASYSLVLEHVRTETHGATFDRMHHHIEAIASAHRHGRRVRAAGRGGLPRGRLLARPSGSIARRYRRVTAAWAREPLAALADMAAILGATSGLDEVVDAVLAGLSDLFGFTHSLLLLHDEYTGVLFTIASHGYDTQGIGSEVRAGEGIIGMAAAQRSPMRVGNLRRLLAYARSVRRSAEEHGTVAPGPEIPLPGLRDAQSQMAVPMLSGGALIGVIAVETALPLAGFDDTDELVLNVVGQMTAHAIVAERALAGDPGPDVSPRSPQPDDRLAPTDPSSRTSRLRHFAVDGSTFLDDAYLIRGVAGRLLWKLVNEHIGTGRIEFTNREARLDPALQLPGYRDNFESRLILLKRRLDERQAAVRILSSGRGRFRLVVDGQLDLDYTGD